MAEHAVTRVADHVRPTSRRGEGVAQRVELELHALVRRLAASAAEVLEEAGAGVLAERIPVLVGEQEVVCGRITANVPAPALLDPIAEVRLERGVNRDLPDPVLRLRRRKPRGEPGARQRPLLADVEEDDAVLLAEVADAPTMQVAGPRRSWA